MREILADQLPEPPPPLPEIEEDLVDDEVTYESIVGPLLIQRCGGCHGDNPIAGLDLTTYEKTMQGSDNGPVVLPGDPANSPIILVQVDDQPHFAQFSPDELDLVTRWIENGALE